MFNQNRHGLQQRGKKDSRTQSLTLVNHKGYLKECVASTAQFEGHRAEVVIALCHGAAGFRPNNRPSALHFRCDGRGTGFEEADVYAKTYAREPDAVTLHSIIGEYLHVCTSK